jgi:hypothetical protein
MADNMRPSTYDGHAINDGTNYVSTVLNWPGFADANHYESDRPGAMPVLGTMSYKGIKFVLLVAIENSASADTLRKQLSQWFDPKGGDSKQLVFTDSDGVSNPRYLMVRPSKMMPVGNTGRFHWAITLVVDGAGDIDGRLRRTTTDTLAWSVTSNGDTQVITNDGEDDAYPVYKIKPTAVKSNDYNYSRWCPIRWRASGKFTDYPTDIVNASLNTASLISGGKLHSTGRDLSVYVNGVKVPRWIGNLNAATSRVWVTLDWSSPQEAYLGVSIPASGSISFIRINPFDPETGIPHTQNVMGKFPASGILMIDNEAFQYTSKNDSIGEFYGITRAVRGTSEAAHTGSNLPGTLIWGVQHDITIVYDNTGITTDPAQSDAKKPLFDLDTSTNTSWVYGDFGDNSGQRPYQWGYVTQPLFNPSAAVQYTTSQDKDTPADPWAVMGTYLRAYASNGIADDGRVYYDENQSSWFRFFNQLGIKGFNITNGYKMYPSGGTADWRAKIFWADGGKNDFVDYLIPEPTVRDSWQTWSRSQSNSPTWSYGNGVTRRPTTLYIYSIVVNKESGVPTNAEWYLEFSDCTITLDDTRTPSLHFLGSEISSRYNLDVVIENTTTGEQMRVQFPMRVDETFVVDTDKKLVYYEADGSNQFQAMTLPDSIRRDWLKLQPGSNTLKYNESGVNTATVTVDWVERFYD